MGYNTPLMLLNDNLGVLNRDPDIGKKIDEAVRESFMTMKPAEIRTLGCSLGTVLPSEHADVTRTVVIGGNSILDLTPRGRTSSLPFSEEAVREYLDNLVGQYGYRLVKP